MIRRDAHRRTLAFVNVDGWHGQWRCSTFTGNFARSCRRRNCISVTALLSALSTSVLVRLFSNENSRIPQSAHVFRIFDRHNNVPQQEMSAAECTHGDADRDLLYTRHLGLKLLNAECSNAWQRNGGCSSDHDYVIVVTSSQLWQHAHKFKCMPPWRESLSHPGAHAGKKYSERA